MNKNSTDKMEALEAMFEALFRFQPGSDDRIKEYASQQSPKLKATILAAISTWEEFVSREYDAVLEQAEIEDSSHD